MVSAYWTLATAHVGDWIFVHIFNAASGSYLKFHRQLPLK